MKTPLFLLRDQRSRSQDGEGFSLFLPENLFTQEGANYYSPAPVG